MKRVGAGTLTVGVTAVLFGLLTAYVARHYCGAPTPVAPRSAGDYSPLAAGGEDCPQEPSQPTTATGGGAPTLAPPRGQHDLAASGRLEPGPRGQVILVQVEAQQADPEKNGSRRRTRTPCWPSTTPRRR